MNRLAFIGLGCVLLCSAGVARATEPVAPTAAIRPETDRLERVVFRQGETDKTISGRVLVEAADGGLLLESPDSRLATVEPEQFKSRELLAERFRPLSVAELGRQLQQEVGGNSEVVVTRHYVICTRANRAYAQWCGALFERLYTAFQNYWKQRGIAVREPEFLLPAIVFADPRQFADFATADAGSDAAQAKGYYSTASNRIVLYDLTGSGQAPLSEADIARRLAAAPYNIATVIHEATHQIAFNTGVNTRYADNPLWLTEGMAMYFETPDLASRTGWKTAGAVNDLRLRQFHDYQTRRRPADSLETLIKSDERFTDPKEMEDAYAEAWALSYFLVRARRQQYSEYLNKIGQQPRLVWDGPEKRLARFRNVFGDDLRRMDAEFQRFMQRVK